MWEADLDGRRLTFRLAGINNQNFLMRDEQTGSWWQQVTGEAILGPLRGRSLKPVFCDELSFAVWRREHPGGRVLKPAADPAWQSFSAGWEAETARLPVPRAIAAGGPLSPRTLVVGLALAGEARAYPFKLLARQGLVLDAVAGLPVALLLGPDGSSARAFERRIEGRPVTLFAPIPPRGSGGWVDGETGSTWDFSGRAVSGPLAGRRLVPVPLLKDYWFDWKRYHPRTTLYNEAPPL